MYWKPVQKKNQPKRHHKKYRKKLNQVYSTYPMNQQKNQFNRPQNVYKKFNPKLANKQNYPQQLLRPNYNFKTIDYNRYPKKKYVSHENYKKVVRENMMMKG